MRDLASAARHFEERFGLASLEGGRHPSWGTANRIVPLGDAYLELVAIVDPDVAVGSTLGRWVADRATDAGRPLGWAVRTDDLDVVAGRLGLGIEPGSRSRPDGSEVRWRSAGVGEAAAEPCLPFFIEWAEGVGLPGRSGVPADIALERVLVRGDAERLSSWLGEHVHAVEIAPGRCEVVGVVLSGPDRRVEISG